MKQIIEQYTAIRSESYDVFEKAVLPYAKSLSSGRYTFKERLLLMQIKTMSSKGFISPTDVAHASKMNPNTLSNHLKRFMKENLITKAQSSNDHRIFFLAMTQKGHEVVKVLSDFYRGLFTYLFKALSAREKILLVKSAVDVSNMFSDEVPLKYRALKFSDYPYWLEQSIARFYRTLVSQEEQFLTLHTINLTLRDWYVVTEVYILSQTTPLSLKDLQKNIKLSMSTMSTVVSRLTKTFLQKTFSAHDNRFTYLEVSPEWVDTVEAFLLLRIRTYEKIQTLVSPKNFNLLLKVFGLIKTYVETHEKTHN